jgi:LPXTG-site transpeptidase (sortase) family protein
VDTVLEHKGLTDDGALDVPDGAQAAAWYNLGSRPGEIGSAIIDGHFGYENRRPAIFDFLHTLTPGDQLYVEDEKGETIIFEVRKLETYGPDQRPGEVFDSKDGKSHLNVITCAGSWDKKRQTYDKRLVVFSDKKIEPPSL